VFDAGSIEARLTLDPSAFNLDLAKAEARVKAFEDAPHKVKITTDLDTSSMAKARSAFAQLDQAISKDAMSRLRSSSQGSVLGALNALFSPHPLAGAPTPQQAASQGLLGKMVSAPAGGGPVVPADPRVSGSPANGTSVASLLAQAPGNVSTTDTIKQNLTGTAPGDVTTTDTINQNVVGTGPKDTVTTDTVEEKLDPASAAKTEGDTRASGDRSGTGWAASFAAHLKSLLPQSAASAAEKAAGSSGDRSGSGFFAGFSAHAGPFFAGFVKSSGDAGKSGGDALDKGLLGGVGPGILGISTKISGITAGVGAALGALPALAGIAGTGAGVALVGGITSVVIKGAITAVQPAVTAFEALKNAAPGPAQVTALKAYQAALAQLTPAQKSLAASLEGMQSAWQNFVKSNTAGVAQILSGGMGLLPGILSSMSGVFQAVVPQMASVLRSLGGVVQGVLGVAKTAVPAFAPFINAVLGLVTNILPGLDTVIKATIPFISQFAQVLGSLGRDLGSLFATAAPAIGASMQILSGLLGLVGDLLPVVMKLADIFATALAPVFVEFTGVIRTLIPPLVQIGTVIASFAGAVIGDLASAFGAVSTLIAALAPSLAVLATTLSGVFTVMENAGVFAIFGDTLENLAVPLANLINALVTGLAPVLPVLVSAFSQLVTAGVGALSAALGAVLVALTPVVSALATAVTAVVGFLQATGLLLPVMAGLALAFGPVSSGLIAMGKGLALFAGSGFVTAIAGVVTGIRDFIIATEGATVAEKAMLAGELAFEAVSPFAWIALAVAPLALLTAALIKTSAQSQTMVGEFAAQQQAIGYNIDGYTRLAAVIDTASTGYEKFAKSSGDAVRGGAAGAQQLSQQLSAQALAVALEAGTMQDRLTALSAGLGVSQVVIEQWASAAGISATKFAGAGENVGLLTAQIVAFVDKNAQAVTATASLSTNIAIFGNDVFSATAQLDAFNGIWNTLVGNLLSKQEAVTSSNTAFDNLSQTIKTGGANSDSAKQSFQQYIAQIGSSASTLIQQGASIATVNGYLQTQIDNIAKLGPLNASEKADLAALKTFQDDLANSTKGLNAQQLTLISQFEAHLIPDLVSMHADTPKVTTDISNLTNSIVQTGAKSAATAGDRAKLIADLEAAGVQANTAKSFVNNLQTSIGTLKGKVVNVGVTASAQGTLTAVGTTLASQKIQASLLFGAAEGGYIGGQGGPKADDKLIRVSSGEYVVQADAVSKYGVGLMNLINAQRFASGGPVNMGAPENFVMGQSQPWAQSDVMTFMSDAITAFSAANKAALAAVAAALNASSLLHPSGSGATIQAMMQSMAASVGWTGAEWTALNAVEMREAGYNLTAQNPTSDAYGLAQFINGASEYAQYGGNSTTATGQITAMLNYIKSRYGDPIAAEAHEAAFGWYGSGGMISEPVIGYGMNSGRGYVLGENGSEMVTPVGGTRGGDGPSTADVVARLDRLIRATEQVPAGVGAHVGGAINGSAHDASFRSRYPRS
jgi:hypothetical protein